MKQVMTDLKVDYGSGGVATIRLPGAEYHVRGMGGCDDSELENVVFLSQVHGSEIVWDPAGGEKADGMIMSDRNLHPGLRTADCLPVFIKSPGFTAAFHAGWRGLAGNIAGIMMKEFPEKPDLVLLGNCICRDCYSVGDDVLRSVTSHGSGGMHPPGKLDLKAAALQQMQDFGLPMECPVYNLPECTRCSHGLFHSYRRNMTEERNLQWMSML